MPPLNANLISSDRKRLGWPVAGLIGGVLIALIPSKTGITLQIGIAAWCADLALVLLLSTHPMGTRVGCLMAGLFMAVPCFVRTAPLPRFLLMCFTALPFAIATVLVLAAPIAGFRARLAYVCSWCGTLQVKRHPRRFDAAALLRLMVATAVFAAAIAVVKVATAHGSWLPVRWLAGGIMVFAFAEMATACLPLVAAAFGLTVPLLFQSPYLSATVGEFWTQRWNVAASKLLFHRFCFAPLARHGVWLALSATFVGSAVAHVLLAYLALRRWGISLMCGAFFLVQPLLIAAERHLAVRRWPPAGAGRAWTLTVLAITSPLFVEPALQIIERSWGAPDVVLLPTTVTLGFVTVVCVVISLASIPCRPAPVTEPER